MASRQPWLPAGGTRRHPGDGGVADFANDLRNANAILNERRAHALSDVDKKGIARNCFQRAAANHRPLVKVLLEI